MLFCRRTCEHSCMQAKGRNSDTSLWNPMLNLKNIKSEKQARRPGVGPDDLQRNSASNAVIGDWDAHSIAIMAQITAHLRLRGMTCREPLG